MVKKKIIIEIYFRSSVLFLRYGLLFKRYLL